LTVSQIDRDVAFILEADRLKNIARKTRNVSNERHENDAEHSWHACLMAMTLEGYANTPVDLSRVLQMLVVHDLGEIYSGDVMVYMKNDAHRSAEMESARRLLSVLTAGQQQKFRALLQEFESRETPDAKYANAIDRTEPILQNIARDGEAWKKNGIAYQQIVAVNQEKVSEGSRELWRFLIDRIDQMKKTGIIT
jgi:putative hydrolases of HD superfamily